MKFIKAPTGFILKKVRYELSNNNCSIPDYITEKEKETVLEMFNFFSYELNFILTFLKKNCTT